MERQTLRRGLLAAAAGVMALGVSASWAPEAHAVLQLRLTDNVGAGGSTTIVDNGPGDLNAAVGRILVLNPAFGAVDVNTVANDTSGTPGVNRPFLNIDPNIITDDNSGPLDFTAEVSNTDFSITAPTAQFITNASATVNGGGVNRRYDVMSYIDLNNVAFSTATLLGQIDGVGGELTSFAETDTSALVPVDQAFSLTLVTRVQGTGGATFNFDANVQAVPEPGTLSLAGLGLLGLGLAYRRRRKTAPVTA